MSGEIPSLVDLQNTKVRIDHFAELIDGTPSGTSTNPVTGVTHPTYEKAIKDLGFKPASFTFVTGGTLGVTDADKCIYNPAPAGDNNWYSWSGYLPHTVAPGTNPALVGSGYVPRTDVLLRVELAEEDSPVLIAGESSASLALLSAKDNYTKIREGLHKATWLLSTLLQSNKSVVITGDSLSFNGFGYTSNYHTSGAGYATNNPFGLSSWAHLLRDLIFTSHASFLPIERCNVLTSASLSYSSGGTIENFGINGKVLTINFSNTATKARISTGYSGSKALIVSLAPAEQAVNFNVNGVTYNNASPDGHYKGYGYKLIPMPFIATIDSVVKQSDGQPGSLTLYGCGSTNMTIPKLTGKGAWTSGQILAEFSTLVEPYNPDIVYYIIGANDIASGVPVALMADNLRNFITSCRTLKPSCEVVLISTPPCSSYSRATAKTYIKAMRRVADETNSSIIDLWSELELIPPTEWRHDNIHFNTQGDTIVFSIIRALTLPGIQSDISKFHPCRQSELGTDGIFMFYNGSYQPGAFTVAYKMTSGSPTVVGQHPGECAGLHSAAYIGSGAKRVTFSASDYFGITAVDLIAANDKRSRVSSVNSFSNWDVSLIDSAGNNINVDGSDVYFYVTYSRRIIG